MALVKVARLSELKRDSVMEAMVDGEPYAVCNLGGEVFALGGVCPHRGGPLGQGTVNDGRITCPWHAWEFDCRTGVNDYDEACRVPTFAVQVQGDDVLADLP